MSTMLVTRNARKLITVPQGVRGAKGDPGGNVMAIGLFADAGGLTIPAGTDMVRTSGHSVLGLGGAYYVADAAVDAAYVTANPLSSFIDMGGRGFKLVIDGTINVRWFGAVGDGSTDDGPAFAAALEFIRQRALSGFGFSTGGSSLFIPKADDFYWLNTTTLEFHSAVNFFGEGHGDGFGGASVLKWADDTTGLRVQYLETSGAAGYTSGSGTTRGAGTIIERLALIGGFTGTESESHGIQLRDRAYVRDVFIDGFSGDGVFVRANAVGGDGAYRGNANGFKLSGLRVQNCRNGFYIDGPDANAGMTYGIDAGSCRQWAIWDSSFLGNTHVAPQAEACGITAANDGINIGASVVSSGGNRYCAIAGQETGASTNAPSGTTADNAWWAYLSAGGSGTGIPAWSSGILVRAGGSYHTDDANSINAFIGAYTEGGQGIAQLTHPSVAIGGRIPMTLSSSAAALFSGSNHSIMSRSMKAGIGAAFSALGDWSGSGEILTYQDASFNTYRFKAHPSGDFRWDYGNGDASECFRITGINTSFTLGSSTPQPHYFNPRNLAVGQFGNARPMTTGTAAPASGAWGRGAIVWNVNASAGGKAGWICVTAGSPGTWKAFGVIDA